MESVPPPPPLTPPPQPLPPRRNPWKEVPFWQWGGPVSPELWKWILGISVGGFLSLLVLGGAFASIVILVLWSGLKPSDVHQTAVARAKADQRVTAALGVPIKEGFGSGKTNVINGSGEANLAIPISGPKGKGTLYAVATKSAGKWTYSKLVVEVDATGETIDLGP